MSQYARNHMHNVLVVSMNKEEGTFVGKDLRLKITYGKLKISEYYFYDFC